jgi:hypothetical protein
MRLRTAALSAALSAVVVAVPAVAAAQTFTTSFGGAGYTCLNQAAPTACNTTGFGRPASNLWNAGDFARQTITGSGLTSITGLDLNLNMQNLLGAGRTLTFDVFVNSTSVGSTSPFVGPGPGAPFFAPFSFNFAAIVGPTFAVELRVRAPGLPVGSGSVGLFTDGQSRITLRGGPTQVVPEPSTYALLASGLAVLGSVAARRRRASVG